MTLKILQHLGQSKITLFWTKKQDMYIFFPNRILYYFIIFPDATSLAYWYLAYFTLTFALSGH